MAKASCQNGFDGEGRKLGERYGLDTRNLPRFLDLAAQTSLKYYVCGERFR